MEDKWEKLKEIVREVVGEELDARGLKAKTKVGFVNGKWIGVTKEQLDAWMEAYPAVEIQAQLKLAAAWILSNPMTAPKSNFGRFLNTWLTRQQNQASLHAIPTARTIAIQNCDYCETVATGKINGRNHCRAHGDNAMNNERPLKLRLA